MNDQKSGADLSVTTFATVVIHKDKLLETLEVNRAKHNSIYEAAVSGYWEESQRVLVKKQEEFAEAVAKVNRSFGNHQKRIENEFAYQASGVRDYIATQDKDHMGKGFAFSQTYAYKLDFNTYWPLTYPENHLEDYGRVIDLLKYSVADKVELSSKDFDAYVRNNWSWRQSFLGTNTTYLTGCLVAISGCVGSLYSASGYSLTTMVTGGTYQNTLNQLNRAF